MQYLQKHYLQAHTCLWPVISTKNYIRDKDGWYHPKKGARSGGVGGKV